MCNLFSMTTTTEAIQKLVAEWEDVMRNIPVLHAIYPDYTSPLIKQRDDKRVLPARTGIDVPGVDSVAGFAVDGVEANSITLGGRW